jgi:hypothetical protein
MGLYCDRHWWRAEDQCQSQVIQSARPSAPSGRTCYRATLAPDHHPRSGIVPAGFDLSGVGRMGGVAGALRPWLEAAGLRTQEEAPPVRGQFVGQTLAQIGQR